ncbi:MAG: trehalose-phosphatase [Actinomycetia bacterium]|nr:trehalose-phosphatase [Actinomycetes bacterium]MCP4961859.1 trehalose-phosphatase [Actinomycetes bacterium]
MGIRKIFGDDLTGVHVFTDFDGTLSNIVDVPSQAGPVEGVGRAVAALRDDGASVTVVSGRPVVFLRTHLGRLGVDLVGLYGLESDAYGETVRHPEAERWIPAIRSTTAAAAVRFEPGMVEAKGLSLTVHFRGRPEMAEQIESWARETAERTGLEARPAKQSIELHPPINFDKGSAVRERLDPLARGVVMIGDDVGDLPAYEALDEVGPDTTHLKVVVKSSELDGRVAAIADLTLDSPDDVVAFLNC